MKTSSTQRRLGVETLENRELMAGNVSVSVSNGNLFITGDANANHVQVRQSSPGVYSVSGVFLGGSSTKINNSTSSFTARGITGNVSVSLGGGNDHLEFGTGDARQITVPKALNIDMGTGHDWTYVRDVKTGNSATINTGTGVDKTFVTNVQVNGTLAIGDAPTSVNAGDRDEVGIIGASVRDQLRLVFRGGNDSVEILSSAANDVFAEMGDGNDFFKMLYTKPRSGGFTVKGGRGSDIFFVPDYSGTRYNGSEFESVRR